MRKALKNSEKLAAEINRWQKRLAPRLPDIDPSCFFTNSYLKNLMLMDPSRPS